MKSNNENITISNNKNINIKQKIYKKFQNSTAVVLL